MRREEGGLLNVTFGCLTANRRGKRATHVGFSPYLLWLPLHFATPLHFAASLHFTSVVPLAVFHTAPGPVFAAAHTVPGPVLLTAAAVRD